MTECWQTCDDVDQALIAEILMERYGHLMLNDVLVAEIQSYLLMHGYRMLSPRYTYGAVCHDGIEQRVGVFGEYCADER